MAQGPFIVKESIAYKDRVAIQLVTRTAVSPRKEAMDGIEGEDVMISSSSQI